MLIATKPWLVQADLITMVKKKPLDFEAAFEALINDPAIVNDEGEGVTTSAELCEYLKERDIEFADVYRAYYDEISEHGVTDYVNVHVDGDVTLSWKNPHEGDPEKG